MSCLKLKDRISGSMDALQRPSTMLGKRSLKIINIKN